MRTLILALTVLLFAAPVWATVTISLEDLGDRVIAVNYTSDEAELIRAFALDIQAYDGNIIDVNNYSIGDDNGGYGIFPGTFAASIAVNPTTGQVDNWDVAGYSPVAPASDPDALGGVGTDGVTIEMGSLYDTAAPGNSGMLCTVTVDENVTKLCVTANGIRGNVVLESAAEALDLILPDDITGDCWSGECFPSSYSTYGDWVDYGKPQCWCDTNPFQCDGDFDNATETFFKYRIYGNDLAAVVANWKKKIDTADPCADFDHKSETFFKYRVYGNDLAMVVGNWKKKDADLTGGCPRAE
jgi:hypothetical protein